MTNKKPPHRFDGAEPLSVKDKPKLKQFDALAKRLKA